MTSFLPVLIRRAACWLCLVAPCVAMGQSTFTNAVFDNLDLSIPDGNLGGVANTQTISGLSGNITGIQVSLDIVGTGDGAFNGDYYVLLVNSSDTYAVLLNRVGRTAGNPFGYADNGLDVTFDDSGSDIHLYQNGAYATNGLGQVTGTWAPDGRYVPPNSSLDTTPRTALLSNFLGTSPNGMWTLLLVDASNGGTGELAGWSLDISTAVPEPGVAGLLSLGLILVAGISRRR
jgi:subtilisin-like proprotein convertase family protein